VSLTLRNLELIPVNEIARFHMGVDGSGSAELAVSVRGKVSISSLHTVLLTLCSRVVNLIKYPLMPRPFKFFECSTPKCTVTYILTM
jgi:hypothetical protein